MEFIKFILVVYLISTVFVSRALAADYFYFYPRSLLVGNEGILKLKLCYLLENYVEEDFILRPKVSSGLAHIFNKQKNLWVSSQDLWSEMPYLSKEIVLKLSGYDSSEIYFQILNLVTGEIYETPIKMIWFLSSYQDYLISLNRNILSFE